MVICLEQGADLHMAQRMPLPPLCSLTLASVKSRLVLPFWHRLTWVVPEKGPLNGCVGVWSRRYPLLVDLPRHTWSLMNRFRAGQGPCRANFHKWGLAESPACDCGQRQTMNRHIVDTCPLTKFEGGLNLLHEADDDAVILCGGWNLQRLQHSRNK